MRWLQHISFSSSPSSSPSSSSSSLKPASSYSESPDRDRDRYRRRGLRFHGPKLTRQKKLRHLTDLDVWRGRSSSSPSSAAEPGLTRSPSTHAVIPRSSSAVPLPLPLPLPEGDGDGRRQTWRNLGDGKGVEDKLRDGDRDRVRDRNRADAAVDRLSCSPPLSSVNASVPDWRKTTENSYAAVNQDSSSSRRNGYWVNIPTMSAPTSPYASPILSPHRMSSGDVLPLFNMAPRSNQVWSAPEMPFDVSGLPPPAFYDPFSTDNSPIHSPQPNSPRRQARSPGGPSSPLHPMLSPEHSATPRDGISSPLHPRLSVDVTTPRRENSNVHPLPLPPGAAGSSSASAPISHVPLNQDSSPMNCQWIKGKLIGRGTFGSVYVASNRETGALCAMKEVEIFPDDPKSAECIKQLEQEIKLLSNLQHQNIVQYYGSEIVEDRFFIYLEYVHPGSINKYIRDHCGAMTESVVRNFTRHILSGLAYLHSKKTVHRDIKGANLLVDASGVVKLADFGMAKHLTGQRADLSLKGSPYWMAPELMQAVMQKDNNSDLAFAIDIWSLGCTIIEMFTGKPPWSEYEGAAAMFKVMKDSPPIPESMSAEGKDFLRFCFRRNPAERPTAAKLLEHRFLKNSQLPTSPSPPTDVSTCSQLFNGMKLTEHTGRKADFRLDQAPAFPSFRNKNKKATTPSDSENGQQRYHSKEPPPNLTASTTSRLSPRSTLEAIPSPSPPRLVPSASTASSSAFPHRPNRRRMCKSSDNV
ncbi:PREDICTED: serine/threonine-protein kinase BCK1/SLK1/SSP31-like [Tarenaya hassleriana]|uniref:serine/threonine-protein kinase BCK1/SLK1/SSP31-like n=1 Tax=Tarenaya hassleriana TaxID=28532 RepID=UPI00053C8122|nr:PREDICTED: serine/threonine-protein kinase BCK1/SLK1/SSP31-like [Tarenaya hassleriana]